MLIVVGACIAVRSPYLLENNPPKTAARLPTAVLPPVSTVGATILIQTTVKVHLSFGLVPNVSCHSEALLS